MTESSLVAYWLGLWTFTAMAQVQSLVRELRSGKLQIVTKKEKKKKKTNRHINRKKIQP